MRTRTGRWARGAHPATSRRTVGASLLATLVATVAGITLSVVAPGTAQAAAIQPHQILVRPAVASNPLNTAHRFTVEVRADVDGDGRVDDPIIGAAVDMQWSGPPGSMIVAINGVPVPPNPFGAANCITIAVPTEPNGGVCTVDVSSPIDVGTGTLTASYAIVGSTPGAPDLSPIPADQGTTCTGAYLPGPVIESCTRWVDVVRVQAHGDHTWVGYLVDVDDDARLPVGAEHTFSVLAQGTDAVDDTPAAQITANFAWMQATPGSGIRAVNGQPMPGGATCTTSDLGLCTVTVSSTTSGSGTLRLDSLVGALIGGQPKIESPTPSSDRVASATWVDWRVVITPPDATNLTADPHTYTLQLQSDDGGGWTDEGLGHRISTTWRGPQGSGIVGQDGQPVAAAPLAATSCITLADGRCTITVNSPITGQGELTATSVEVSLPGYSPPGETQPGDRFTYDVTDASASKTWIDFVATVSPSATNLAGEPHTFTIDASYDDGGTLRPVPDGSSLRYLWSGIGSADPHAACTTTAGRCSVVVTADALGVGTLEVRSITTTIGDATFAEAPVSGLAGGAVAATKTWVDYRIDVSPDTDENLVATDHVFTVSVERDAGEGFVPYEGATPSIDLAGVGSVVFESCSEGTAADGTCTVIGVSEVAGDMMLTADLAAAEDGEQTRLVSATAHKLWVDYRITLEPEQAINKVGEAHLFEARLEVDRGSGFTIATSEVVQLGATGVGAIVDIDAPGPTPSSCVTDAAGTCRIVVNSEVEGSLQLTASYAASVGDTSAIFTARATKGWVRTTLPVTGGTSAGLLGAATSLAAAGLVLVMVARRRRTDWFVARP